MNYRNFDIFKEAKGNWENLPKMTRIIFYLMRRIIAFREFYRESREGQYLVRHFICFKMTNSNDLFLKSSSDKINKNQNFYYISDSPERFSLKN